MDVRQNRRWTEFAIDIRETVHLPSYLIIFLPQCRGGTWRP
jgi:hypothetical protein